MRFRLGATLAFSFLVFIVALLASVGAKETYPVVIYEPKNDDTWVAGSTVTIKVTSTIKTSAKVWLRPDSPHSGETDAFLGIFDLTLPKWEAKAPTSRVGGDYNLFSNLPFTM